jgi:hypothetical protein
MYVPVLSRDFFFFVCLFSSGVGVGVGVVAAVVVAVAVVVAAVVVAAAVAVAVAVVLLRKCGKGSTTLYDGMPSHQLCAHMLLAPP